MLALENADEILQILDRFTKQKSKEIPPELEEYIDYVAKTGDTVYRWPTVQYLFREKLRNVIKEFHDTTASIEDLPQCPNVDQFNYESMKTLLFERFDHFQAAPFTIQRLCELLTAPKKHYSRLDKFMRALEKNILVVSTIEPGRKPVDTDENGDDSLNGDILSGINIGIELNKNILKVDGETTNGSSDNGTASVTSDTVAPVDEIPSSSGLSKSDAADTDKCEKIDVDSTEAKATVDEKLETKAVDEKAAAVVVADSTEKEPKKIESTEKIPTPDQSDKTATIEEKPQKIEEDQPTESEAKPVVVVVEEKLSDAKIEDASPIRESIGKEKPPTPKRACSDDEDETIENGDHNNAKKIKLDVTESNKESGDVKVEEKATETVDAPKVDAATEVEPKVVDVPKEKTEKKIESISAEDAQKEDELLETVVDSVLAAEEKLAKPEPVTEPTTPTPPPPPSSTATIAATETSVEEAVVEKKDAIVADATATVTAVPIPETVVPAEQTDVKLPDDDNITEPIVQPDEMTVEENNEKVTEAADTENAMEAAPIKPDEEQMDVDESNSADAMDL